MAPNAERNEFSALPGTAHIAGSRILVVDDDPESRLLIERLLGRQGFQVTSVANGREGLRAAGRRPPDLILMDVEMPEMDGYEATGQLKADPFLAAIPVIILTARSETAAKLEGLDLGADDYIAKPFDRRELIARVRSLLRISAYRRLLSERNRQIESELDIARLLQQRLLPASLPQVAGLQVEARYVPMDKVGGDFFDTHVDAAGRLGIFLADVSGHGIPGAFFSTVARMALHYNRDLNDDPVALLEAINTAVLQYSVTSIFLTALFARIDPREKTLHFALAGQCRPLLHRRATGEVVELVAPGTAIGLLDRLSLEERSQELRSGDRLLFFTDGLIELKHDFYLFDEQALGEYLRGQGERSAGELADGLLAHVRGLTGSDQLADDLTLLIVDVD